MDVLENINLYRVRNARFAIQNYQRHRWKFCAWSIGRARSFDRFLARALSKRPWRPFAWGRTRGSLTCGFRTRLAARSCMAMIWKISPP